MHAIEMIKVGSQKFIKMIKAGSQKFKKTKNKKPQHNIRLCVNCEIQSKPIIVKKGSGLERAGFFILFVSIGIFYFVNFGSWVLFCIAILPPAIYDIWRKSSVVINVCHFCLSPNMIILESPKAKRILMVLVKHKIIGV